MITTERLELHPFTVSLASAILAGDPTGQRWVTGFPRKDDQDAAQMFLLRAEETFPSYVIVVRETGDVVGTIGFFGPPDDEGVVMIGYGLAEVARGNGYATEAVIGLAGYAFAQPGVKRMVADTDLDNVASHRVLEKAGFQRTHSTDTAHWFARTIGS